MKKTRILSVLSIFTLLVTGCFSPGGLIDNDDNVPDDLDYGYLKIVRQSSAEIIDDEYIFVGEYGYQYLAKGKNKYGEDAYYTNVATWESSNPDVLVASVDGMVKAMSDGVATLKATYGDYSDEIEVKVATFANYYTKIDPEEEYKTTETYDMPIYLSPRNALVKYTFSDPEALELKPNNQFTPLKQGVVDVTAKVYISMYGRSVTYDFQLNIIDIHAPYFKYQDEKVKELSLDVAVNKYDTLDINDLGIYAYSGFDDSDISNDVVIDGEYDLHTVGTYLINMCIINDDVATIMPLTLNITEREKVSTNLGQVTLTYDSFDYSVSSSLRLINFSIKLYLPVGYEDLFGEVYVGVDFDVKHNVSGRRESLYTSYSRFLDHSQATSIFMSFTKEVDYDVRAGSENITINSLTYWFRGNGNNYITY